MGMSFAEFYEQRNGQPPTDQELELADAVLRGAIHDDHVLVVTARRNGKRTLHNTLEEYLGHTE